MSAGRRRFRIIKEIAEGGFGKVYLAEQISSDGFSRIVAVKLLHAKWSTHDEIVMRTRDEARLLGLIRHQHIVKVEDLTAIDGKCAIVMEYLEGCDLKWMISFLSERGLDFPRAALFEIVLAVSSALDAAYNGVPLQGGQPLRVIHRDIKPSNIFVTVAGGAKVLDFGTARANFAEREAKTQALAFGSQGYMAPERMLGEEDTPAADVFSLGIALYEILALESFGRIPPRPNKFAAKVEERVRSLPLSGDPEWCDQVRDTLRLMLSYEASERPTAAQLVEIMELLAHDANDMGLRRFCRTLVAEAKANIPDVEVGDPLTGRIVEEDHSFGVSAASTFVGDDLDQPQTERIDANKVNALGASAIPSTFEDDDDDDSAPTMRIPSGSGIPNRPSSPQSAPAPPVVVETDGGGSGLIMLGGGAAVFALAALLVLIVLVVLILAYVLATDPSGGGPAPSPTPAPTETPKPTPAGGLKVSKANDGGVRVVLSFATPEEGGKFTLRGPNFSGTWDGMIPAELDLSPGKYKTNVVLGSDKYRYVSFVVDKKSCAFTFEPVDKGTWKGACK